MAAASTLVLAAFICIFQQRFVTAFPAVSNANNGSPRRGLASADSCGGVYKACITCDIVTAGHVMSRESRSIRNLLTALVEDVQLMSAQIEDLLLKGGVASVRTSLELCDDGPGSMRPPDYCGENSSNICPGSWSDATCALACEVRDWGSIVRNWPHGTYVGHADCSLDREAELWAGTVFMEDLRARFVVNGSDVNDTGHNGSWVGNRTREIDLAIADNIRTLMPKFAARNSIASAAWAGVSSDVWVYWPPVPSKGFGNWIMGDMMGMDALLGFDGSSHPELEMRSHVGEFIDVALPYFNPTRETVWTNPYADPLGAGMMISVSQPLYFTGTFGGVDFKDAWIGAMGMDIVLQEQQALLSNLRLSQNAQCLIVNDNLNVMISPDSVVQLIFNDPEMLVENTVRSVPEVVPEDCQVCCARFARDCVMSLTEANGTDWVALKAFLSQVEAGTAKATTQQLFWPTFSTNDPNYQGKSVNTLFIFDRWAVDHVKAGQWSVLCMLPADELPNSIVATINMTDDLAARAYLASYPGEKEPTVVHLRASVGEVSEGASFTVTNTGTLDLVISSIVAPEALILAFPTATNASSGLPSSLPELPHSLPALDSFTVLVSADTRDPSVESGNNDLSVTVTLEDDNYQDCSYKVDRSVEVHLFLRASSCPAGSYLDDAGVCLLCASGTYKAEEGSAHCQPCTLGHSTNGLRGASYCQPCALGFSTDNAKGIPVCAPCSRGTYTQEEGSNECKKCPLGQYQNNSASTDCIPCGEGTVTLETGSTSTDECVCPSGMHWSNFSGACEPCQVGLRCEWMPGYTLTVETQTFPLLLPGYFALEEDPTNVWQCHANAKRCPGGPAGLCSEHRKPNSFVCSSCEKGYKSSTEGSCVDCGGADLLLVVVIGVLLVSMLGAVYYLAHHEDKAKQTKSTLLMVLVSGLALNLYQQFSVLSLLPVSWPNPFANFLKALSIFSFNLDVLSLNCFATVSPFLNYATRICLVLAMFFVLVLIHCLVAIVFHNGDVRARSSTLWGSAGSVFMALMLSILAGILAPLQCQPHPNGLSTMLSNDAVVCWTDYYRSTEHGNMVFLSLAACLMPISFYAIAVQAVLELPRRLKKGDAQYLRTYFFLFSRFRMEYYWFVLLLTGRNTLVALVPALPDATLQWCVLSFLSLISLIAATMIKPWRCPEANYLDIFLTTGLLVEMGIAAMVMDGTDMTFIGWSTFVVAMILVVSLLVCGLLVAMHRFRRGKAFQYFLCHHKLGAGNFARLLKFHLLAHKYTQRKVFVDSDDLQDLSKLFSFVRNDTEHLILLGSQDVLRRYWCVGEVTVAALNDLAITVVALPGFSPLDDKAVEDYIEATNMQLTQHGIDAPMMRLALKHVAGLPPLALHADITNAEVAKLADTICRGGSSGRRSIHLGLPRTSLSLGSSQGSADRDTDGAIDAAMSEPSTTAKVRVSMSKNWVDKLLGNHANQATRLLLCDQSSTEAVCTACIIQLLLVPHLAEVLHILDGEEPVKPSTQQVIILCTAGLFEQNHAIRSLWAASQVKADFCICSCDASFRFPTDAFYRSLRELATAFLSALAPEDLNVSTRPVSTFSQKSATTIATVSSHPSTSAAAASSSSSADILVLIVKSIFEEIAVEVNPQDHETVLTLRIQTLAGRLMDPIRSKRGTEQRERVLQRALEAKPPSSESESPVCDSDVYEDEGSEGNDSRPEGRIVRRI